MQNTEVTLREYRGLSDELLKKLSGSNGHWWLNRFKNFLRKENPWDIRLWETWKTIEYGDFADSRWLKKLCSRDGKEMCSEAYRILKTLQTTEERSSVELQIAPLSMLGFERWYSLIDANRRIRDLGFDFLTPEMVFNLHRQGTGRNESAFIAMKPLTIDGGDLFVFSLASTNDSASHLNAYYNPVAKLIGNITGNINIIFAKKVQ